MTKFSLPFIIFEVTETCNHNCSFCYNFRKKDPAYSPQTSDYNKIYRTLKKIYSISKIRHITFSGGEPLLLNRLPELVLFSKLKKSSVSVLTNGNCSSPLKYKTLIDVGVNLFQIPILSSTPEIHDKLTGVIGSWNNSISTIKQIRDLNGKTHVTIVLTKLNHEKIENTISFISSLGIRNIMINRFNIGGRGIIEKDTLLPENKDWKFIFDRIDETAGKLNLSITSNVCFPECILETDKFRDIKFSTCAINSSTKPLTLSASGDLRICNHSPRIMGNIFKDNLNKILNSEYLKEWERIIPDYCRNCEKFGKCFGGCRAACEQLGLPITCPDPLLNPIL